MSCSLLDFLQLDALFGQLLKSRLVDFLFGGSKNSSKGNLTVEDELRADGRRVADGDTHGAGSVFFPDHDQGGPQGDWLFAWVLDSEYMLHSY